MVELHLLDRPLSSACHYSHSWGTGGGVYEQAPEWEMPHAVVHLQNYALVSFALKLYPFSETTFSENQLSHLAQDSVKQGLGNLYRKWAASNPVWYSRQHIIKLNHHVYPFFLVPEASTLPSYRQVVEGFIIGGETKLSLCPLPFSTLAASQVHANSSCWIRWACR